MPTSSSPTSMTLRSSKIPSTSQNVINKSKLNSNLSTKRGLTTKVKSQSQNSVDIAISDESQVIKNLKFQIEEQNRKHESAIEMIRTEFKTKCVKFESIVECYERDIERLSKQNSKIVELLHILNATTFDFALPMGFNKINPLILQICSITFNHLNQKLKKIIQQFATSKRLSWAIRKPLCS